MATPSNLEKVVKGLSRNEAICKGLVSSAFDLNDAMYNFAIWMSDDFFIRDMHTGSEKENVNKV